VSPAQAEFPRTSRRAALPHLNWSDLSFVGSFGRYQAPSLMKRFLRSKLEQWAPTLFFGIRTIRSRRYFRQTFSQHHADFRRVLFPDGAAIKVQAGPFQGLRYLDETVWGSITPKWLGSYEAELHSIIHGIAARSYQTIIDVGCAEGYYAVGLAVLVPAAEVLAFDADFISRKQLGRLAQLNSVSDRIQIRSFCRHSDLDALSSGRTLVVCDVEGFEEQLLDPQKATSLLRADILVEIHETSPSSRAMEQLLQSRFEHSHHIERVVASDRESWLQQNRSELPSTISHETLRKATEENRTAGQVWLWMRVLEV